MVVIRVRLIFGPGVEHIVFVYSWQKALEYVNPYYQSCAVRKADYEPITLDLW
jgi:hypothetical protein